MRSHAVPFLLVALLLTCCSCRNGGQMLFFCDPASWEVYARRGLGEKALEKMASDRNSRLKIQITLPGARAEEELNSLLLDLKPERVYITPLYAFDVASTAARFPGTLFIRERLSHTAPGSAANLVRLVFGREQAFTRAGEAAAFLVARPDRATAADVTAARAGILSVPLSGAGRRELAAFRAGFAGRSGAEAPVERVVDPPGDRAQARRALEEMREEGAVLILLKTYELTTFCLEELRKQGGRAIIEDYEGNSGYEDVVLLSIEDDLSAAFADALMATAPVLEGVTYLRWGGSKPVPDPGKELNFVRE